MPRIEFTGQDRTIRILIIDAIPETREALRKLLQFERDFRVVGDTASAAEGIELAKQHQPDVVLIGDNVTDVDVFDTIQQIRQVHPGVYCILTSVSNDADIIRRAMAAGASDFLQKPIDPDKLYATIHQRFPPPKPPRPPEPERSGKLLAVYSPTGGAGCSTIAANLAYGFQRSGAKTLLIDAVLPTGDITVMLNVRSKSSLMDAVVARPDDPFYEDVLESLIYKYNGGFDVIGGAFRIDEGIELRDEHVDQLVDLLQYVRQMYDFVVIDAGHALDAATLAVLEAADHLLVVVNPTLPSIGNVGRVLAWISSHGSHSKPFHLQPSGRLLYKVWDLKIPDSQTVVGQPEQTVHLIVNKYSQAQPKYTPDKVRQLLKYPVVGTIPVLDEAMLQDAVTRGRLAAEPPPGTGDSPMRQVLEIADHFYQLLHQRYE